MDWQKSLIIGTNKRAGLSVYNLRGEEIHFAKVGHPNNVDLRSNYSMNNGKQVVLVGSSERLKNELLIHELNPETGELTLLSGGRFAIDIPEIYGFCMYQKPSGDTYAIVNNKAGQIQQWLIQPYKDAEITGKLVRTLSVATQPEGMVADDEHGYLYVGEEGRGIWRFSADPSSDAAPFFIPMSGVGNPNIIFDLEGLTIYKSNEQTGYLIASSQGNNTYAIFDRLPPNQYKGSFRIASNVIDGTEETDGIAAHSGNFGPQFPGGIFVAQDGKNKEKGKRIAQNFKIVAWERIANCLN